ncbi:low molecular weight protein arginine phosphatase [Paenisporosarcina indica]|uniref:low molecular weight protein arginine phosphatase n=1 Tax=Paenisporosarcina indica TaxID=650093 RepID=UPI00094F6B5E|nr:low molecular weight protein arginine phosphatase [Paenisporosarcina indica]
MNIYFICTGNTCRSPMAEALFQSKNKAGMEARSAGIYAMDNGDISRNTKQVIKEAAIEFTHFSRQINEQDVRWADLILTMTSAHKQMVMQAFPFAADKIFTLKEYVRPYGSHDVSDPFGGDIQMYRQTFQELARLNEELHIKLTEE